MDEQKPAAELPRIIRQDEEPDYENPGAGATIWTVHFKTPSGVESRVTLPGSEYTPENVARLIVDKTKTIEAVHRLDGAQAMMGYR